MRADVNVSVRKPGGELGTRTETKNVNSVRFVMAVVEHEAKRQVELIEERRHDRPGNAAVRPRQGRDALAALEGRRARLPLLPRSRTCCRSSSTRRSSTNAARSLPELPDAKRKRYEGLGITPYNASVLTAEVETARWFDALLDAGAEPKQARQLGRRRAVRRAQPARRERSSDSPVSPGAGGRAARPGRRRHDLAARIAKQVFEIMLETGEGAADDRRERAASSRPATPARSTPRSTRSSPPTPTRSPSTRRGKERCSASSSARR